MIWQYYKYAYQLEIPGSHVIFLQDILYAQKDLPKGAVPHFTILTQENYGLPCDLLHKYCSIFPVQLPKRIPPNKKLGDVHLIMLEPGIELV